jgi:hypothetical protein
MNFQRIKAITWLGTLLVGAYLAWSVTEFLRHQDLLSAQVTPDEQLALLDNIEVPPPPSTSLVDYDFVSKTFHDMNWTGKAAPKPTEPRIAEGEIEAPTTPVSDLLSVLLIQVDTRDEKGSLGFVKYLDSALAGAVTSPDDRILRIESKLSGRYSHIRVSAITVEGIEFSFDGDEEREKELVPPVAFPSDAPEIVKVGSGGAIMPAAPSGIEVNSNPPPFRPERTFVMGTNQYLLGTEDLARMDEDYSRILSQDMRYSTHRDPVTGDVDGLEIDSVKKGSLPAQHGLTDGEVLKSVNGHRVTGVSDLMNFVREESAKTDTWVAVFEKRGREFTRTYKSPPPE